MPRLILASRSPHRLQLLRAAGFDVEAVASDFDEPPLVAGNGLELRLMALAQAKAHAVLERGSQGIILAADTVGLVGDRVFGKPADRDDARHMLQVISGSTHFVLTGWCLARSADRLYASGVERTTITMRPWAPNELEAYLDSGEWIGKSGAYGLRLPDDPFVDRIVGSASNVVGVPIERLRAVLDELGWGG